jgi:hypothetical protein
MKINWENYDQSLTKINLTSKEITEMNWEGCPPGLTEISLSDNKITEMNWIGCPRGLTKIELMYNQITEMNWIGCPRGLTEIKLEGNQISEMNWAGCPHDLKTIYLGENNFSEINWEFCPLGLKKVTLNDNKISEINWENSPNDLTLINLRGNQITEMNWDGSPPGLTEINLGDNQITEINWDGSPSGLTEINLSNNQITEMNSENLPSALNINLDYNPVTEMDEFKEFKQFIKNRDIVNAKKILSNLEDEDEDTQIIISNFIEVSNEQEIKYAYDNLSDYKGIFFNTIIDYELTDGISYILTDMILYILTDMSKGDITEYIDVDENIEIIMGKIGQEDNEFITKVVDILGPVYYSNFMSISIDESFDYIIEYLINKPEILISCSIYGNLSTFEYILSNTQVDPASDGNKAIIFASSFNDVDILKKLQEYPGVDVNATINGTFDKYDRNSNDVDFTNFSSLSNAIVQGTENSLRYLLEIANYDSLDLFRYISPIGDNVLLDKFLSNPDVDPSYNNNKIIKKLLFYDDYEDYEDERPMTLNIIKTLAKDQRVIDTLESDLKRKINEEIPGLFKTPTLKQTVKKKLFPLLYNYDSKSQKVCDLFKPLDKKELEYVANIYNIDKKLSRAKICNKLGTILQSYIKNKEENIDKCNNNETSIGGDSVKDIPARRFFTYTQNDKVYCEDLEEFYGYIESGGNKNPFTGVKLADDIISYITKEYRKLKMDVFQKYTEANTGLTYSAHLANLLTKLHYPRNDDWYKALSANEVINFIKSVPGISTELTNKSVRTLDEIRQSGIQELVKFIEDDSISPDKDTKKILISQMWNGDI